MFTKSEVIAILEQALANPNYLSNDDNNDNATNWFCCSVFQVLKNDNDDLEAIAISGDQQSYICTTYVYPSLNEKLFLRSHLALIGEISDETRYDDPAYKVAAHKHWQNLIDKLKMNVEYDATLYIPGTPFEMKGKVSNITHEHD